MDRLNGGSPKILAECIVLWDPNNRCFIAFLWKNFRIFGVCVVLWDPIFSKKSTKNPIHFKKFFRKSMFYASKWSQMKRFERILTKSPIKLHTCRFKKILKNFEKFWKCFQIWPPTLKSLFIAFSRKKFWLILLFYRSKSRFCVVGTPSPPRISLILIVGQS